MQFQLAPSLLSANFLHLSDDVKMMCECSDIAHLDVMDGTFVPNISFGFPVIDAIAKDCTIPMDVHLMIINPDKYFERVAKTGAAMCSFHLEAARMAGKDPRELLLQIKALGMKAGLVINPDVPVEELFPYLQDADFVLLMTVFAGFGGQKFIQEGLQRIARVKEEIARTGVHCLIEVDGGVNASNAPAIREAGADIVVAGSAFFCSPDPRAAAAAIKGV